jgi:hypothetical protein
MQVHNLAAARAKRPARVNTESDTPSFGKVHQIETARRARQARIPFSVYEEMEAAHALFEELEDQGLQVRFSQLGGRVAASLCDLDGNVVRSLSLLEAIGMDIDPETAA